MIAMPPPRGLIIGATRSGAGKTTITLGLLRAYARLGLKVQPFKCGPDYIDSALHAVAAGRPSYNLDGWAMHSAAMGRLVTETASDASFAIVEGVMGLFDGAAGPGQSGFGRTSDLAACFGWPVILVLDVAGQSETAAALALGCRLYRDDMRIAGVILNRVASPRHYSLIAPAFERVGIPIFGTINRDERLRLPERHLGLVQAAEHEALDGYLDTLADRFLRCVDMDALAAAAAALNDIGAAYAVDACGLRPPGQRVAIASDRAFSFMYPHILRAWRTSGAEIIAFSPLADEAPDDNVDAVWLPGGYPELHAATLASASNFKKQLRALAIRNVPIHGECGGYMVLGRGLEDAEGQRHEMVGLLSLETSFARRKLHLGYRRALLHSTCPIGTVGEEVLGHEFHYACTDSISDPPLAECRDAQGALVDEAGARRGSVSGTFFHAIDRTQPGYQ